VKPRTPDLWKMTLLFLLAIALPACSGNPANTPAPSIPTAISGDASGVIISANDKLNLNLATREDFLTVPGLGDRMVREFMEYRPYVSVQQFRREIGKYVSAEQVAEYEKYVFVPVDVNASDAETLKQLPDVDDTIAAELIAARPYNSNDSFVAKLATYVPDTNPVTVANHLTTP